MGWLGWSSSRNVAPTVAAVDLVRLAPATGEAIVDGVAALFDRQSRPIDWAGRDRHWVIPDPAQASSGERFAWLDDDDQSTFNTSTHAGSVERLRVRGAEAPGPAIVARGSFGAEGLTGRLDTGTLAAPRDAVIVGLPGPALAVRLGVDGDFRAGVDDLLDDGQYNPDAILADDARWRQEATRRLLESPEDFAASSGRAGADPPAGVTGALALRRRPWIACWCDPRARRGWELPDGFLERRSTLALLPLEIERTPPATPFRIPSAFLVPRLGTGTQGKSMAFDNRRGEWVRGLTSPTDTLLRFELPAAVLPCRLDSGRLSIRMNAPARVVEIGVVRDGVPAVVRRIEEPTGLYEIDLGPDDLGLAGGAVQVSVSVSPTAAEAAARQRGEKDAFSATVSDDSVMSTWEIDHVRLAVDGHTLEGTP